MTEIPALIPLPEKLILGEGRFDFPEALTLSADSANQENLSWAQRVLGDETGIYAEPVSEEGHISLAVDDDLSALGDEGYQLSIRPDAIRIQAFTPVGVFYGIQTLAQLLSDAGNSLPVLEIEDRPQYAWRGFMLDEGRHFQGAAAVKRMLDVMAALKMNIFHWHLTEDQGWRIQIERYPRLTEIGSVREGSSRSLLGFFVGRKHDGVPHSGFYTQDEIREIVAYAAARHITVVPEIEMPGHCVAALAAYPEYSCRGEALEVRTAFGISENVYCIGNDATLTFLEGVLDEVIELFPGPYLHLGGDEVPRTRWKACPKCQQRMAAEGFTEAGQLHLYLINRMAAYLAERGKQAIGWNENLMPGLHSNFIIQHWFRGDAQVRDALEAGRQVIFSPYLDYYLDHSYSLTPLSRAYAYQPGFPGLSGNAEENILGVETPLWTEWVPNQARLDYQVFPRLLATAETGWTAPASKNWTDFYSRYQVFKTRLDRWEIGYAPDKDIEPGWLRQRFGMFSIAWPQTKTAS